MDRPRYPIESVDNALRLLSMFTTDERIRVTDVAQRLDVAMGTAHRLLAMLLYHGFVVQEPATKAYVPGPMLLRVGLRAVQSADLRTRARPILERLHAEVDETIHLAVLHGSNVFFLDGLESSKALRVVSRAGASHPAHCTSVGKALLAWIGDDRLRQLYRAEKLTGVTASSIRSRRQLLKELTSVRERGYATNVGELEDGIASIAVPIRGAAGQPIAALGVGAPVPRFDNLPFEELVARATRAAAEIEADIATFGEPPPALPSEQASAEPA
jgi:IclR family transcriptional regulator, acetate operon repressor